LAFNISPKGEIEGVLLETARGHAQINFPKHDAATLAKTMRVGAEVELLAEPDGDEGEHPVYVAADASMTTSGKIVRLNYALHGEVNGYHLDNETFLHVKPEGAKKYKLRVGEQVKANGAKRAGRDAVVLEVESLERVGRQNGAGSRAGRH
jgi:hypothetical protein